MTYGEAPVACAIEWTADAQRALASLPPALEVACRDVVEEFAEALAGDRDASTARSRRLPSGDLWTYRHPSPVVEITYRLGEGAMLQVIHVAPELVPLARPVFISYSHKDRKWLQELRTFLFTLEEEGLVAVWVDTDIRSGQDWLEEIRRALASARIAVLLVTQDFLISPFVRDEELPVLLERARSGNCSIFWIAVKTVQYELSPLRRYQAANDPERPLDELRPARRNRVYKMISQKIRTALQDSA